MDDRSSTALRQTGSVWGFQRQSQRQSQRRTRTKAATIDLGDQIEASWRKSQQMGGHASSADADGSAGALAGGGQYKSRPQFGLESPHAICEPTRDEVTRRSKRSRLKHPVKAMSLSPSPANNSCCHNFSPSPGPQSLCASSKASKLSDSDRELLLSLGRRNSHALARRARKMLQVLNSSSNGRAAGLLGDALLAGATPTHVDGFTLVEKDRDMKVYQLDEGTESRATNVQSEGSPRRRQRFLGFRKVKATMDELSALLGNGNELAGELLNQDMIETRRLHTLADPSTDISSMGDAYGRHVGLNWMSMQPPSRMGLQRARLRDFLVLEDKSYFPTPDGKHGWVHSMHSVHLPWTPPRESTDCVVRASMYQTGIVAIPSPDAPDHWLDVMCAVEFDLKGNVSEKHHRAMTRKRLSCLSALDEALVSQRLQRISFMDPQQFDQIKLEKHHQCHICAHRIGVFGKHFLCRKCGSTMCKKCSVHFDIKNDTADQKKARVCTRCILKKAEPKPPRPTVATRPSSRQSSLWQNQQTGISARPDRVQTPLRESTVNMANSSNQLHSMDDQDIGTAAQDRALQVHMAMRRSKRALTLPLGAIHEEVVAGQQPTTEPEKVATSWDQEHLAVASSTRPGSIGSKTDERESFNDADGVKKLETRRNSPPTSTMGSIPDSAMRKASVGPAWPSEHWGKKQIAIQQEPDHEPAPGSPSGSNYRFRTRLQPEGEPEMSSNNSVRGSTLRVRFLVDEIML